MRVEVGKKHFKDTVEKIVKYYTDYDKICDLTESDNNIFCDSLGWAVDDIISLLLEVYNINDSESRDWFFFFVFECLGGDNTEVVWNEDIPFKNNIDSFVDYMVDKSF